MQHLRMHSRPDTSGALFLGAFSGWNDGSGAAVWAVRHLAKLWSAEDFAEVDPDLFYDFATWRPQVKVVNGTLRRVTWPTNRISAAKAMVRSAPEGALIERDIILGVFEEPQLHWPTFVSELIELCTTCDVREVVLLGSLLGQVPHTAPVRTTGVVTSPLFSRRMSVLGIEPATYEGDTGVLAAFQDGVKRVGLPSISLWAIAPHYIAASPNLPVAAALLDTFKHLYGATLDISDVRVAAHRFLEKVSDLVGHDEEAAKYVQTLEQLNGDLSLAPDSGPLSGDLSGAYRIPTDGGLPSPEEAIADVEEWLRQWRHSDRRGSDGDGDPGQGD
jgi:PAC2 family protein